MDMFWEILKRGLPVGGFLVRLSKGPFLEIKIQQPFAADVPQLSLI